MDTNWDKLRKEFFEECTDNYNGLRKINLTPHNLFNWFVEKLTPKTRNLTQNRALHLYWSMISEQMNNAGYTEPLQIRDEIVQVYYTPESIKEFWRKCQLYMFEIKSTTKINTEQINKLIDICSFHYGNQGVYVEFPNWQSFMIKLDNKN